jgi:transposase
MEIYPRTAAERAMKLQEVLLRATSGKIKWWQAAELIGISERQMRRWRKRYEEQGYQGLLDRRLRKPSSRRVPKEQAEEVLGLYRDKYFDLNVRHFHEKLGEEHQIGLSYTWVKQALQAAGLVRRKARRGVHRKRAVRLTVCAVKSLCAPGLPSTIHGPLVHSFTLSPLHYPQRSQSPLRPPRLQTLPDALKRNLLSCFLCNKLQCLVTEEHAKATKLPFFNELIIAEFGQ